MNVLITGARRGLGYELSKVFYDNGHTIIPLVRKDMDSIHLTDHFPDRCHPITADITDDGCTDIIRNFLEKLNTPLDMLINNAGIPGGAFKLEEVETSEISKLFETHCLGVIRVTKASLPFLRKSELPKIINISSRLGSMTMMSSEEFRNRQFSYSYRISKAAENMLSVCLNHEFRDTNIEVYVFHPGKMKTQSGTSDADLDPTDAAARLYAEIKNNVNHNFIRLTEPGIGPLPW